ncbi:hypothetical protein I6A60_37685 [Frankia sp. AgB1.9]|uniref:hypothetical protein n=1 Tax=unclassified Frankia TaxID=2632575 RepID=UPI0019336487|nr:MULTISPECIES: hypothetical protein [unclassified Frankia]MBL7494400.1 hypothetical protein [Frankia sp. AgW1.1]MBL7553530.1 hypothetical protein [Frankia sp. AgB1.9]MBL7622469.1 hypothetical protein [Frankia sp. AgB1.8]
MTAVDCQAEWPITDRDPDDLPPVWNLPVRNVLFVGQDDAIERVAELLRARRRAVVCGPAGQVVFGRTQTAIEYAYRYHLHYDAVWMFGQRDARPLLEERDEFEARIRAASLGRDSRVLMIADRLDALDALPASLSDHQRRHLLLIRQVAGPDGEGQVLLGPLDPWSTEYLLHSVAQIIPVEQLAELARLTEGHTAAIWTVAHLVLSGQATPDACVQLLGLRPAGSPPAAGPTSGVTAKHMRDEALASLAELLYRVEQLSEPQALELWLKQVERRLRRQLPRSTSSYRKVVLGTLLELAVQQSGPELLDTMITTLAELADGDQNLPAIRAAADRLRQTW